MKKDNTVPYAIGAAFIILFIFLSFKPTSLQSVVGIDCPEFKTSIETDGDGIALTNSWVAIDCDNDGAYEAYGYSGQVSYGSQRPVTGQILNRDYYCFNSVNGMELWIYQSYTASAWRYWQNTGGSDLADLTCAETIPEPEPEPTPGEVCVSDVEFPIFVNQWINQEEC